MENFKPEIPGRRRETDLPIMNRGLCADERDRMKFRGELTWRERSEAQVNDESGPALETGRVVQDRRTR